jgi:hypothetical protein
MPIGRITCPYDMSNHMPDDISPNPNTIRKTPITKKKLLPQVLLSYTLLVFTFKISFIHLKKYSHILNKNNSKHEKIRKDKIRS